MAKGGGIVTIRPGDVYGGSPSVGGGCRPRAVVAVRDGEVYWVPVYAMREYRFRETSGPLMNGEPRTGEIEEVRHG